MGLKMLLKQVSAFWCLHKNAFQIIKTYFCCFIRFPPSFIVPDLRSSSHFSCPTSNIHLFQLPFSFIACLLCTSPVTLWLYDYGTDRARTQPTLSKQFDQPKGTENPKNISHDGFEMIRNRSEDIGCKSISTNCSLLTVNFGMQNKCL